jgi:hypothetical protein
MAVTALAVQQISRAGITPAFTSANADGHTILNDGKTFLEVRNADGSAITVTIDTPQTVDGLAVASRTVSVGATTGVKMIGPFPLDYNQPGTEYIQVTFSAVTSVTVGAFRV